MLDAFISGHDDAQKKLASVVLFDIPSCERMTPWLWMMRDIPPSVDVVGAGKVVEDTPSFALDPEPLPSTR